MINLFRCRFGTLCGLLLCLSSALLAATKAQAEIVIRDGLRLPGHNGVTLAATLMTPAQASATTPVPAIVFVNSWALDNHEYLVQAAQLASKGYVVLSYATRGFGTSGGLVNVAGPDDMADFSRVLDWLIANTATDPQRIGVAGISFGAGISLLGAAHDPRVRAVAALSGWADLSQALYGGETPDMVWGGILLGAGYLTGRMDPIVAQMYNNLLFRRDIAATLDWAESRSPKIGLAALNQRQLPIYISNNFRDELFEPNAMMTFYQQLQGPKKLDLNLGNHATAELGGLLGLRNHVWTNVQRWFDRWLQNTANGIELEPRVSMAIKLDQTRDTFADWPDNSVHDEVFYLGERDWFGNGDLRKTLPSSSGVDRYHSGLLSGATAGIPVVSTLFEAHLATPIISYLPTINRLLAVTYESPKLRDPMRIRGVPRVSIWLRPNTTRVQTIAYLYDVDAFGFGTLITHGPVTLWNAETDRDHNVAIELIATAYDVAAGHHLALVLDTNDPQYSPPQLNAYHVDIPFTNTRVSTLAVPTKR